jgi:23S rRNA pseudouridine1911/1915/1917 synthase
MNETGPFVTAETTDYLVVYKPARIHSAPLNGKPSGRGLPENTLLDWCALRYPELPALKGRKAGEGGLLHRLDYETQGLVLFARNQFALDALLKQQEEGFFVKEYGAFSGGRKGPGPELPGFPPFGSLRRWEPPFFIKSAFRPYGPGRKSVRPVVPVKTPVQAAVINRVYETGLFSLERRGDFYYLQARIKRGFRHQVRCHLAWLGFPLLNDGLYGGSVLSGALALKAQGISFLDPRSGEKRDYRVSPLREEEFLISEAR